MPESVRVGRVRLFGASIPGRDHIAIHKNNQDAFAYWSNDNAGFGIVSDGCGSGEHSEVGSALTVTWLGQALKRRLDRAESADANLRITSHIALEVLKEHFRGFVAESFGDQDSLDTMHFMQNHLLATVVGFAWRGNEGVVFAQGDGTILLGDTIAEIDEQNQPKYPLYQLMGRKDAGPRTWMFNRSEVNRVAVATDGFNSALMSDAFKNESGNSLKRWMNVKRNGGAFADDATAVFGSWSVEEPI